MTYTNEEMIEMDKQDRINQLKRLQEEVKGYQYTDVNPEVIDLGHHQERTEKACICVNAVASVWDETWYRKIYRRIYNLLDWLF